MTGFPPAPEDQVSLANWREAPFNRWSFRHVREIIPTADIAHNPHRVRPLPIGLVDTDNICIRGAKDRVLSLDDFLMAASTDSLVILHRGRIIVERYADGMTAETPHILMSVSKSLLGLLTGILVSEGIFDLDRQVTTVIPEVSETAYKGATIRHLLDMRTGVAFDEDYTATSGPIVEYRKATNWHPPGPGDRPSDLRSFYQCLRASDGRHGGRFHYVSPNTDLLGWVIERATGRRFADLMSRYIWKPMGAQHSAYITVDRLGAPRCAGGICATARDPLASDKWLQTAAHARERKSSPPLGSTISRRMEALMHGMPASSHPSFRDERCTTGTSGTRILARRLCYLRSAFTGNTFLSTGETSS
jgi:hypothetical protein